MAYPVSIQKGFQLIGVYVRHGDKVLLRLMLQDGCKQAVHLTGSAEKHLAFPVLDILLDVEGDCLRNAEVFHVIRHIDPQFGAQVEEMIYSMT